MSTMWLLLLICANFVAAHFVNRSVEQKLPAGFHPSFGKNNSMDCSNKEGWFYPNFVSNKITCLEHSKCFPIFIWMQQGGILPVDLIKSFFDEGNSSDVICALRSVDLYHKIGQDEQILRWHLECSNSNIMKIKHSYSSYMCQLRMRPKRGANNLNKLNSILDLQHHQNSLTYHQKQISENEEDNTAMIPPYQYYRLSPKDKMIRYWVVGTTLIVAVCFAFIIMFQFCCTRNKISKNNKHNSSSLPPINTPIDHRIFKIELERSGYQVDRENDSELDEGNSKEQNPVH